MHKINQFLLINKIKSPANKILKYYKIKQKKFNHFSIQIKINKHQNNN